MSYRQIILENFIVKKKLATLLVFVFASICVLLTGCNLFDTNNYAALSSIVATCGDVSVSREELITAYNSWGYYYTYSQYGGLSREGSLKQTASDLIDQKYLIKNIDDLVAKSKLDTSDKNYDATYASLELDAEDYQYIVGEVWEYIDDTLAVYKTEVRKELGLTVSEFDEEDEESVTYSPQSQYETKFEKVEIDGATKDELAVRKVLKLNEDETVEHSDISDNLGSEKLAREYAKTYNYSVRIHANNNDYKKLVWSKYISALKSSQKNYGYSDMTTKAVFEREVDRLITSNITSRKLTKFQEFIENRSGFDAIEYNDETRYAMTDEMLQKVVDKYKKVYKSNYKAYALAKESYNKSTATDKKNSYLSALASTSSRGNYVYYGDSDAEKMITVTHILIKLTSDEIEDIEDIEEDTSYLNEEQRETAKNNIIYGAKAYERDDEGHDKVDENGEKVYITIKDLISEVQNAVDAETSIEKKIEVFNKYLYKYNVDSGIINAEFDYVVGATETSSMVEDFTKVSRELYEKGVGSVGVAYNSDSNYSGVHIVLCTGVLENTFNSEDDLVNLTTDNVFDKLSTKTSISYNETIFEYFYDLVASDNYSTYQSELLTSLKSGKSLEYVTANFSDLF